MKKYIISSIIVAIVLMANVYVVSAQESEKFLIFDKPELNLPGTVDCFDYYDFGSVKTEVSSLISSTVPSVPMTFQVNVFNENNYPIVNGAVYVKIYKRQTSQENIRKNGHQLVDQFFAKENFNLDAQGKLNFSFDWKVPAYSTSGDYEVYTYVVAAKKFNLQGLSFTDDVRGGTYKFTVNNKDNKAVEFNKNTVEINNEPHIFVSSIPQFSKDENITVKAELTNSTDKAQQIPVSWNLYSWDGLREETSLNKKQEIVSIEAGGTKSVEYTITDKNDSVYFLVAEAHYKDTKSILNTRVARENVEKIRLNFPGINKFPLKEGEMVTMFSCLHAASYLPYVDNNKLVLSLVDSQGKEIASHTYTGKVSGEMMGVKSDFVPKQNYDNLTLKAQLYHNDQLVDSADMQYDCQKINPQACGQSSSSIGMGGYNYKDKKSMVLGVSLLLTLILISLIIIKKRSSLNILFLGLVFSGLVLGLNIQKAEAAKEAEWDTFINKIQSIALESDESNWNNTFKDVDFEVHYFSSVYRKNVQGNYEEIPDGTPLSVGDELRLNVNAHQIEDIFWTGTGQASDTPYGHWIENGVASYADECNACPMTTCDGCESRRDKMCKENKQPEAFAHCCLESDDLPENANNSWRSPFSVNPPAKNITLSGTAATGATVSCNGSKTECTVKINNSGTLKATFTFDDTYAMLYLRAYHSGTNPRKCQVLPKAMRFPNDQRYNGVADQLAIPEQAIEFNFNVNPAAVCLVPNTPDISGPVTGCTDSSLAFSVTAADTNSPAKRVRYGFDWDSNGSVDQWMPAAGYVNSGTSQSSNYTWVTAGAKTFQVKTENECGQSSGWSSYNVTINSCPVTVTISGTVKDSLGNPMAGQPIETCQGLVNTDASGYWQHTVDDGSGYCARVNGLPGGSTVVATSIQFCHVGAPSYEHQVAGRNMFFNCDNPNAPSSWDRSNPDTNIDFTVTLGAVLNGSCGPAASPPNYAYNETLFRGAFCGTGTANPANPAFPAEGATTNWQCVGSGAGHTDASCSAIRNSCSPTYSCQVPTCAPEECGITKGQTCINSCTGGGVAESNCPGGSCGTTACPACAKSGDWKEVKP